MKRILYLALILSTLIPVGTNAQQRAAFGTGDYTRALKHATDVMVNDGTSPVAAARYYGYITIAANETLAAYDRQQPRISSIAKEMPPVVIADSLLANSDADLAVIAVLYKAGIRLLPSGYLLLNRIDSLHKIAVSRKIAPDKIAASLEVATKVIEQVMRYVAGDGFVKLSGYRRFTPATGDAYWQPTAPGFMAAVEPFWSTLRTFVLDSCNQFSAGPPNAYSTDSTSGFYKEMREVYETGIHLTKQQSDIANFWDCNPFALQQLGHLEFGLKKISPGGHWMGITGIACKKKKLNLAQTCFTHALVSMAMADAFISCWSNKYKFNRVRPVTAIQRLIDRNWKPLLQTPPFPEYTSGHSVISNAAATVLTYLIGDNFAFTDDTEKEFGLPARKFASFNSACKEAAISRLYGGIHFRDAIENGAKEGQQIGNLLVQRVKEHRALVNNQLHAAAQINK